MNLFISCLTVKNSNIVIFDNEYGSNYITLVNNNLNVRVSKLKEMERSFEDLKRKIDKHTVLVFPFVILPLNVEIFLMLRNLGVYKKINSNIVFN